MANLLTSEEIISNALFNSNEPTGGSSEFLSQAVIYLNRAYRELYMGGQSFLPDINEDWWWLRREESIILEPSVSTVSSSVTAAVTNGSDAVTFSAAVAPEIDTDFTGWHFKVEGHEDIFKVETNTTTTSMTLDSVYTGDDASAASFTLFKLDYTITSSAIKIVGPMTVSRNNSHKIYGESANSMDDNYPVGLSASGIPDRFAIVDEDTIRFNRWGGTAAGELVRVDYDYMVRPDDLANDSNEPLVPKQYRHILSDMVSYYILGDKNDSRQELFGFQAKSAIRSMVDENRSRTATFGKVGHIYPRQRGVKRKLLMTKSGRVL